MRRVQVHGRDDVRVDDVDEPSPGPRDVIVNVRACGICGSDLKYVELGGVAGPTLEPMPLGHEIAGVVEWVGADVEHVEVGDRVVVHPGGDDDGRIGNGGPEGGLSAHLLVRGAAAGGRVFRVPEQMPLEVAALAEPLAVGMRAVEQCDAQRGEQVAVFGCGPIGLACVAALVDRGVDDVVAIDLSATRRGLAVELGAGCALDPAHQDVWAVLRERHGAVPFMLGPTAGTDAYIEASGAASVITDVLDNARPGARLSVVALHYDPIPMSLLLVLMKQLTIRGSMEYPARFEDAIDLLARADLSAMVTHRFALEEFAEALAKIGGSRDCGKVMIEVAPR